MTSSLRHAWAIRLLLAGLFLTPVTAVQAVKPRTISDWTAPDGRTFQMGLIREGVSGLAPDPERPVIMEGAKIVAVGPYTVAAIVSCGQREDCSFLLSTWLPVKAVPDLGAFRDGRDYDADPPTDEENYGFRYEAMSLTDWLAVFRDFYDQYPKLVWWAAALGFISGLSALAFRLEGRGWLAIILQLSIAMLVGCAWLLALKEGFLVFIFSLVLMPTWFIFVPPIVAFALPLALTLLLIAGVGPIPKQVA
jgi:hypothetical protein